MRQGFRDIVPADFPGKRAWIVRPDSRPPEESAQTKPTVSYKGENDENERLFLSLASSLATIDCPQQAPPRLIFERRCAGWRTRYEPSEGGAPPILGRKNRPLLSPVEPKESFNSTLSPIGSVVYSGSTLEAITDR